mmetsp:Transcript_21280/g.45469  ORF Transcript_21280/g.45469 Transcript_21280/m.45469 type:complete len:228 (+) Transcript_21280:244-927(+)
MHRPGREVSRIHGVHVQTGQRHAGADEQSHEGDEASHAEPDHESAYVLERSDVHSPHGEPVVRADVLASADGGGGDDAARRFGGNHRPFLVEPAIVRGNLRGYDDPLLSGDIDTKLRILQSFEECQPGLRGLDEAGDLARIRGEGAAVFESGERQLDHFQPGARTDANPAGTAQTHKDRRGGGAAEHLPHSDLEAPALRPLRHGDGKGGDQRHRRGAGPRRGHHRAP